MIEDAAASPRWRLCRNPSRSGQSGTSRSAAHGAALDLAAEVLGVPAARLRLTHACPICGSDAHGRPVALLDGRRLEGLHLSLSRTTSRRTGSHSTSPPTDTSPVGYAAVAVAPHPVGIDVQAWDATDFSGFDAVAVHAHEAAPATLEERARLWSGKEAVLKLRGTGLERDPRDLDLASLLRDAEQRRGGDGIRVWWPDAPAGLSVALAEGTPSRRNPSDIDG